jgi:hypothetical protein
MVPYSGPAMIVCSNRIKIRVMAELRTIYRNGSIGWDGRVSSRDGDDLSDALAFYSNLTIQLPDGSEGAIRITQGEQSSGSATIKGTGEPPYVERHGVPEAG